MTARRPEVSSQGFDTFLTVSGDLREFAASIPTGRNGEALDDGMAAMLMRLPVRVVTAARAAIAKAERGAS